MGDLLVLAFQTDMTRVATLLFGDDTNEGTYARRLVDCGIDRAQFAGRVENRYLDFGHHSCTHDPAPTRLMIQAYDRWYVQQLLYVLERLKARREGSRQPPRPQHHRLRLRQQRLRLGRSRHPRRRLPPCRQRRRAPAPHGPAGPVRQQHAPEQPLAHARATGRHRTP